MDYKAMDAHSASTALQPKELVKTEYPKGLSIKARRGVPFLDVVKPYSLC